MQEGAEVHIIIQDAKDGIRDDSYRRELLDHAVAFEHRYPYYIKGGFAAVVTSTTLPASLLKAL